METVAELLKRLRPTLSVGQYGRIVTDTSEFMDIAYGDVIRVGGLHYLVLRDESERSFGIEDPKYWVKRCVLLETGDRRILKLVFHESFPLRLGKLSVKCYRSPEKESRILELVRGDWRFMQGTTERDDKGNSVRILEVIRGKRIDEVVADLEVDHRTYFFEIFPALFEKFMGACEAIAFLHEHGEKHGDIRRDHLRVESGTERFRWIDFDYTYDFYENPFGLDLFGLGSILTFLVGKNIYHVGELERLGLSDAISHLTAEDFSLLYPNRVVNLKKIFSYIPEALNKILLHFSQGAELGYETVAELLRDMESARLQILKGGNSS